MTAEEIINLIAAEREAAEVAADAAWAQTQSMIRQRGEAGWDADQENLLRIDTWRKDAAVEALQSLELKLTADQ